MGRVAGREAPPLPCPDPPGSHRARSCGYCGSGHSDIRDIPTEVGLDVDDGMPLPCALSLDNLTTMPQAFLVERVCRLDIAKMAEFSVMPTAGGVNDRFASWTREDTFSFRNTLRRWYSTVLGAEEQLAGDATVACAAGDQLGDPQFLGVSVPSVDSLRLRAVGVVDFAATHLDSRPSELAIARTYRSPEVIAGYRERLKQLDWPLSELEDAAIEPMNRAFRVDMTAWLLEEGCDSDGSTWR